MKKLSIYLLTLIIALLFLSCNQEQNEAQMVKVVDNETKNQVDVFVGKDLFTSYMYTREIPDLLKTVLYPINTAKGHTITRGYPLSARPGERVDHPHHIGHWLTYGDVNGLDFWNNSAAVKGKALERMGTIKHRNIKQMQDGAGSGILEVVCDWLKPDGAVILEENTRFVFQAKPDIRVIDRTTKLTAVNEDVSFKDNKEGMIAIRVTRALEHPTDKPVVLSDAHGKSTEVPVMNNEGVTGQYLTSEGVKGMDAWGKRAKWVALSGIVEGENVSLVILDHPENVGHPTYWHARGYGLFAANPLGQKVFSNGKEVLDFGLKKGESVTFRFQIVVISGETTAEKIEQLYQKFVTS
jgi:hypothetical protein